MKRAKKAKSKMRRRAKNGWFAVWAFVVFFLVYITASFVFSAGSSISTTVVKSGSVEDSVFAKGYVFKDSVVIKSPSAGYVDCLLEDEEKAEKGQAVVAVYKDEGNAGIKKEIQQLDEKIENLEKNIKYKSAIDEDSAKKEQIISGGLKSLGVLSDRRDISGVYDVKKEIDAMLSKNGTNENSEAELATLKSQKSELEKSLSEKANIIYAETAGCFTPTVDGGEELFSASKLEKEGINHSYIKQLESLKLKNAVTSKTEAGAPVGKITDNFKWYLAVEISAAESELLKKGDEIKIRFPEYDSASVAGTVTSISGEEDGKVIVTVRSNKYIKSVYKISKADVQLIKNVYSGIKIPQEALRIVDGKKGVYVRRGNMVKFFSIEIKYTDDEWVITPENEQGNGLKLYDEVIVSGRNLYDNKIIE